jgi:hypothetical protein
MGSFAMHTPPAQNWPLAHPASVVHPPPQIVPEHVFAPQAWRMATGHRPSPLHDVASVATSFAQLAARHDVVLSG